MSRLRDIEISARIKAALIVDPHVGGLEIGVDTVNRISFLTGIVQDNTQKDHAESIARGQGAIDVKNDIEVLAEDTEDALVMEARSPNTSKVDLGTRDRVLGALEADSRVNPATINVESVDGIIRLSGFQGNDTARRRAEEIARRVQGVSAVVNEIDTRAA